MTGLSRSFVSSLTLGHFSLQRATLHTKLLQGLEGMLRILRVTVVQEGPVLSSLPGQPQRNSLPLSEDALQLTDAQASRNTPQVHSCETPRRDFTSTFLLTPLLSVPPSASLPSLLTRPVLSSDFFCLSIWQLSGFLSQLSSSPVFGCSLRTLSYFLPCHAAGRHTALCCKGRSTQSYIRPSLFLQRTQPLQDGDPLQLLFVQLRRQKPGYAQ